MGKAEKQKGDAAFTFSHASTYGLKVMNRCAVVEGWFEILRDFCGGIAMVFANTASVESDFSLLGWEKDKYRLSITDLSLEGILHCKQYKKLGGSVL